MTLADLQVLLQVLTLVVIAVTLAMLAHLAKRVTRLERHLGAALDDSPDHGPRQRTQARSAIATPQRLDSPASPTAPAVPEEPQRTVATDELSKLAGRFIQEQQQERQRMDGPSQPPP